MRMIYGRATPRRPARVLLRLPPTGHSRNVLSRTHNSYRRPKLDQVAAAHRKRWVAPATAEHTHTHTRRAAMQTHNQTIWPLIWQSQVCGRKRRKKSSSSGSLPLWPQLRPERPSCPKTATAQSASAARVQLQRRSRVSLVAQRAAKRRRRPTRSTATEAHLFWPSAEWGGGGGVLLFRLRRLRPLDRVAYLDWAVLLAGRTLFFSFAGQLVLEAVCLVRKRRSRW